MTEPLKCRGVSRDGENPHAAIVYFDRELTQDELRTLHENLSQPASPAPVWRDMDSAPKDGTIIDLWVTDYDCFSGWRFAGALWTEKGWNNGAERLSDILTENEKPTYWMSLPAAPGSQPTEQPPQHPEDGSDSICEQCGYHLDSTGNCMCLQPPQADVQTDKLSGEICTPPIRSTDENGDELITFTSAHTLSDIARWIAENQTDAEEIIRILTDMTTVRALAGEE